MKFAIAYFHLGQSDYQNPILELAVERNPDSDVVLITDRPDIERPKGVKVVDVAPYWEAAAEFNNLYVHKNTCPRHFNLRGIQRWFVYRDWWESTDYDAIFCADSDVMIFSNLREEAECWKDAAAFTLSMETAAGQSFWFSRTALNEFCGYVVRSYQEPEWPRARPVFEHYEKRRRMGKPGGVCDMTFFEHFVRHWPFRVGETCDGVKGAVFDHNFLMPQEYEHDGSTKVVRFIGGHPYARRTTDEKMIRFHTLHMSGGASRAKIKKFCKEARRTAK